jgi:hypothetical protein
MRAITIFGAMLASFPAYAITLDVTGSCPGVVNIDITDGTVEGRYTMFYARAEGGDLVPAGGCSGTATGLDGANWGFTMPDYDRDGTMSFAPEVTEAACSMSLQVMDATTCEMSAVVQTPEASLLELYAAQAGGAGTGFYSMDMESGALELIWDNGNTYSGLAWDGSRLIAMTGNFGHTMHELDPATGDILSEYYTGGYYNGMTSDDDGNVFYTEGCSLYRIDSGASLDSAYFVGSTDCSGMDIAHRGGVGYYVHYGDYGTIDLTSGSIENYGWMDYAGGTIGFTDKTSAMACNDTDCYVTNRSWLGATSELWQIDVEGYAATYVGTGDFGGMDALVFMPPL